MASENGLAEAEVDVALLNGRVVVRLWAKGTGEALTPRYAVDDPEALLRGLGWCLDAQKPAKGKR